MYYTLPNVHSDVCSICHSVHTVYMYCADLCIRRASADEPHTTVNPDGYVDNLAEAVTLLLQ